MSELLQTEKGPMSAENCRCGGKPYSVFDVICCSSCGMRSHDPRGLSEAINAWNSVMAKPAAEVKVSVDEIMAEVQVFASTWSSVGGPFDSGDTMERAEECKIGLRKMIEAALTAKD